MTLPVYFEGAKVGDLSRGTRGVGVGFTYDPSWLENPKAFPISTTMPLRDETFDDQFATPWFANLLPEERQLERVGRLLGRSTGDVYGLLEEIGQDTAGALSIGGPELREAGRYSELTEAELAAAIDRLPSRPMLVGEEGVTMSLAGVQTKMAVAVFNGKISLCFNGAPTTHILKPEGSLYAMPENELLCLRVGAKIGLTVPNASIGRAKGKRYLLVERYDREIIAPSKVIRRHQEDFCQALGFYPTQKYETDGGPNLADLYRVVSEHSSLAVADRLKLLDMVIFGCCIGDTDRHAKNYSHLIGPRPVRLAPAYDLLTALLYEGITRNMAMKIGGKNRAAYIEERHWRRFAEEVGLAPAKTVQQVKNLAANVAQFTGDVAAEITAEYPEAKQAVEIFSEAIQEQATAVARMRSE